MLTADTEFRFDDPDLGEFTCTMRQLAEARRQLRAISQEMEMGGFDDLMENVLVTEDLLTVDAMITDALDSYNEARDADTR